MELPTTPGAVPSGDLPEQNPAYDTVYNLIRNDPFGVYIVDSDFRLAEVSLGARKVFSNVRPLIGRDFAEVLRIIWQEPFATEAIERFRHTLATGDAYAEPRAVKQRQDIPAVEAYDWCISRILLPDSRYGVVCYFYDLSERQQWERTLRESEARFREMADGLPLIVWMHDAEGNQELVNRTFCEFFGVTKEEMTGGRWKMLMHPEDADAYVAEWNACIRDRRPFNARVRVQRADGDWRCIESWARPRFTSDGEFRGFIGTSADVTERIEAEKALRESDRRKDEFLAVLGHELRNPLAPLRTGIELMERARRNPDIAESALAMMKRQLSHLLRMTDDLLDISRISRGTVELQRAPVDLHVVVDVAVEQAGLAREDRSHELTIEYSTVPLPIYGDLVRLTQVVGNLLANATRYTAPGGKISVRTEAADGTAILRVRDNGLGIPHERLDEIFEMFGQVPEHRGRLGGGGLGIGLALARQLLLLHGGSIEAFSEGLGRGSEFIVRLPLGRQAAERPSPAQADARQVRGRRVLVVDDNVDAAQSLRMALELAGHVAVAVHNGPEAIRTVHKLAPEVVLLDIGMPRMNGYEVAERLRAMPGGSELFLVALTGWGQPEDKRRAADAGFDEHLTKPVDLASVSVLIGEAAQRRRPSV
jgi:PAS domain S-box-containing protein